MATEPQVLSLPFVPPPQVLIGDGSAGAVAESNASSTIAITDPGMDLAKKTVCIKVSLSTMGNTRKVSTAQIEADADKDLLRVSKRLVDSAELKAITRFDGAGSGDLEPHFHLRWGSFRADFQLSRSGCAGQ